MITTKLNSIQRRSDNAIKILIFFIVLAINSMFMVIRNTFCVCFYAGFYGIIELHNKFKLRNEIETKVYVTNLNYIKMYSFY